jgi:hypothetical protein
MEKKAKQSTEDPYARITREHFEQERKNKQQHLIGQLKRLLWFFDETFVKNPSQREPDHRDWPFIWPKEEDFAKLDDLVFGLAYSLRKKKKLSQEEAYSLVEERWTSLRLDKFFFRFAKRVSELRLDPPPPNASCKHLEWITNLASGKSKDSACAKDFLSIHRKLRNGTTALSQIKWGRYRNVLNTPGSRSIHLENHLIPFQQDTDIECYAKYLELDRGLLLWENDYHRWKEKAKTCEPFYDWVERNDLRDADRPSRSEEERRAKARKRKKLQRFREKVARIRVTGGRTGSLADLMPPG